MLGHGFYYFSLIRKYVVYFGNIFNEVSIKRTADDGTVTQVLEIPIQYAGKEKTLARVDADPTLFKEAAVVLPAMSFELVGFGYDSDRKLNTMNRTVRKSTDPNKLKRQYGPVAYNFNFKLYVYVKNTEDGLKIIEQILPFFTPDWTATLNLIPEMNIQLDIPIILNGISMEEKYDGQFNERRAIVYTLDFTMKGYLYGPIMDKPIIKVANVQFFVPDYTTIANAAIGNTDTQVGRITVTPGLDSNGNPTSNSSITIPWSQIEIDDDFGYIADIQGQIQVSNT